MVSPLSCAVLFPFQSLQLRASQVVESSKLYLEASLHARSCCWTGACPPAGVLDQDMGGVAAGMASVRGTIPSAAGELSDRCAQHYLHQGSLSCLEGCRSENAHGTLWRTSLPRRRMQHRQAPVCPLL